MCRWWFFLPHTLASSHSFEHGSTLYVSEIPSCVRGFPRKAFGWIPPPFSWSPPLFLLIFHGIFRQFAHIPHARCTSSLHRPHNHRDAQAQAASLRQELTIAKQEASNAMVAARNVDQQLLLASSEAAAQKGADNGTAALTTTAAATAAVAGASAGGAVMASAASVTAVVGGGVGLEIEKGPSPNALRLEELKAELQAATAAKKKVGRTG